MIKCSLDNDGVLRIYNSNNKFIWTTNELYEAIIDNNYKPSYGFKSSGFDDSWPSFDFYNLCNWVFSCFVLLPFQSFSNTLSKTATLFVS
jgi:hypothetical protein